MLSLAHSSLLERPPERSWLYFQRLAEEYNSPLVYLNILGTDVVIINDMNVANDIVRLPQNFPYLVVTGSLSFPRQLNKRSASYSSRPRMIFCGECD